MSFSFGNSRLFFLQFKCETKFFKLWTGKVNGRQSAVVEGLKKNNEGKG